MFSGHLVATTNITTRTTSGMIWVAVMVGSDSEAAAGLKKTPPNRRAARPRIAVATTVTSTIRRRRLGRLEPASRVSVSRVSVLRVSLSRVVLAWVSVSSGAVCSAVLVMMLSSLSSAGQLVDWSVGGADEGGGDGGAEGLGEVDGGGGDGAGGPVDADQQRS